MIKNNLPLTTWRQHKFFCSNCPGNFVKRRNKIYINLNLTSSSGFQVCFLSLSVPFSKLRIGLFVETFCNIFYFLVTYEEYDQHNDEKHNPDVKKKLGIRIVDLVQQGLGQVELQFVLMWVETLLITIKKRQKNNWDSYQFHKNYFQHICVPDPLLNSHALLHPLKQKNE